MVEVNKKALQHALSLVEQGKVVRSEEWRPPSAEEENKYIESEGIESFAMWHLGVDTEANPETKGAWKFIFTSDFKNVDRKGIIAIRQRAGQQGYDTIFESAGEILTAIDAKEEKRQPTVMVERLFTSEVKQVKDNIVDFVITTEDVDRYGERVLARGCEYENYLQNPIVLFAHDWELPVGRCIGLRVKENSIEARTELFPDLIEEPRAKTAVNMALNGILRAVSIGFVPKETKYERIDGQEVKTYTRWELVEYSLVTVPANPKAIAKALETEEKAGRIISQANLERLQMAIQNIEAGVTIIKELIDSATPAEIPDAVISEQYKAIKVIELSDFVQKIREEKNGKANRIRSYASNNAKEPVGAKSSGT